MRDVDFSDSASSIAATRFGPAISRADDVPDRGVFTHKLRIPGDLDRPRSKIGVELFVVIGMVIEADLPVVDEPSPAIPAIPFGPEGERREPGRLADRGPGEHRRLLLGGEVDEEVAAGREIAAPLVDPAFEPLSELERVLLAKVPLDEKDLLRGPAPENHAGGLPPRKEDPETGRSSGRLALMQLATRGGERLSS